MKCRLCVSTAVSALVLASAVLTPASAADLSIAPIYKAPPTPVAPWTGAYVGVAGGGAWGSANVHNNVTGIDQTPRFDLNGGLFGVTGGFNVQNGPLVLGVEGDTSAVSKSGSAFEFAPNGAFNNQIKEHWLSTFRGRIGYAQGNWLLYATAGGALANIENTIAGAGGAVSDRQWQWGWTAGGGVEVKLSQDWSAKVEYLYVGLQDKSYFNPTPTAPFPAGQQGVRLDDHIVRVGVNYKLPWSALDSFFKR